MSLLKMESRSLLYGPVKFTQISICSQPQNCFAQIEKSLLNHGKWIFSTQNVFATWFLSTNAYKNCDYRSDWFGEVWKAECF